MKKNNPILLSFYGLSNGTRNVFFGKLAYAAVRDLSFKEYSWYQNFKTIVGLFRTQPISYATFELIFDNGSIKGVTDESGGFWCEADFNEKQKKLVEIRLLESGQTVYLTEDLYPNIIHDVDSHTIVISDLDDTLIHSFIRNKITQIKTLLFTSVEKRKAVQDMAHLMKRFALAGAESFYLSNSEQNLYPMLFRFLTINKFPPGPLFLRQYIDIGDMVTRRLLGKKHSHKMTTLSKLMELFPNKKYILIGDNTQKDLSIYLKLAEMFPERIRYIIIRKVNERSEDLPIIEQAREKLKTHNIRLHYESTYPDDLPWDI